MFLFVNGGAHSAAAMAVNEFIVAKDDKQYIHQGIVPHPSNNAVSYGAVLANFLKMTFVNNASPYVDTDEVLSFVPVKNNVAIIQDTINWVKEKLEVTPPEDIFVILEWPGMQGDKGRIMTDIAAMSEWLSNRNIRHVFFNGTESLRDIPEEFRYDFGINYINPYLPEGSYDGWLQLNGYQPVITSNEYYGAEAHAAWARHLLEHIVENNMV